ncbi:MAG: lytic transglycosylase domain-containing protein [Bryobacteraceae bacterium]
MGWISILIACIAVAQPAAQTPAAQTPAAVSAPAARAAASAPAAVSAADLMHAAIQKQRAAVRQQARSAGAWLLPWSDEPHTAGSDEPAISAPSSPCDPIDDAVAAPLIETAAKANQIQVQLLHAVIEQESAFHPCAVSSKGAQGLMQLMPDTAGSLGVKDPFDPQQSIEAGARYLKQLLDKYKGDLKLSLGAYNAGPAAVDAAGAIPDIPETRDYVDAILKKIK